QAALERTSHALPAPARRIVIPVCYEADCAPDLMEVAAMHRVEASEVVRLHSSAVYTVQFIGFSPGFAYLAGLPRRLETPRLERPRTRVPAGSIGLAGMQTGVYPRSTPGGWRIIGRTPLRMFDAARAEASTLALGDCVRFQPITRAEFADLSSEHA
ncbi:MAG: 5-oxoprolinase subunit PxpB, partial [Phycisphaerae bacterium]|nr:5-oxoprolinase subunit PxpB [Phycisphaerae bacterium]